MIRLIILNSSNSNATFFIPKGGSQSENMSRKKYAQVIYTEEEFVRAIESLEHFMKKGMISIQLNIEESPNYASSLDFINKNSVIIYNSIIGHDPMSKENLIKKRVKKPTQISYIDLDKIDELRNTKTPQFDLKKLIRFCEELNLSYSNECYFAIAMLTRAILDHVSPIFGVKNFSEVANNYKGSKSFNELMQRLDSSSRKIADSYLHRRIRKNELLPTFTQVNFSNELDILLEEIIVIIK